MGFLQRARRSWQAYTGEAETPLDGDTPAWAVSLVIHVAVLLGLTLIGLPRDARREPPIAIEVTESIEQDMQREVEDVAIDVTQTQAGNGEGSPLPEVEPIAIVQDDDTVSPIDPADLDSVLVIDVEPVDVVPTGEAIGETLVIGGGDRTVGTEGTAGAVDRLTVEIAASLAQRTTVVCWVFDQSVSLAGQRKEIAQRLGRVFDELGIVAGLPQEHELLNLVFAYGQRVNPVVVRPTRDVSEVVKAIESIPVDDTGIEMTFTAIAAAAKQAKVARAAAGQRNVMIVAFTDEVGNDQQHADAVAAFCRVQKMPVYVVGVPAPFGQRETRIKFVEFDPRYADDVQWAQVEQGPESRYPEFVRVRPGNAPDEPIDSGFGPYSLSKLCAETGGIYFAVHANRNARGRVNDDATAPMASRMRYFFDPEVMREYRPDYLPEAKLNQMLSANRAKRALVEAAKAAEISPMDGPTMRFPREDDGKLANLLSEAQKKAAVLAPKIDALYAILAAGAADRERITEKRWRAGYDLALGRVLALKVRTDAYNIMLAQAKTGMKFKNAGSDTWVLEPGEDVSKVGSATEKLAKQAETLLRRVVEEHPGTPWAQMAADELRVPLGYRWDEAHTGVNAPRRGGDGGGGGNPRPGDDAAARNLPPPKPKRPVKNI